MQTTAIILSGPKSLLPRDVAINDPAHGDVVVQVAHSGISTGTEKLFWSGTMPPFPGMGYPLVPGYEVAGEVVDAGINTGFRVGETVFVPGANCFGALDGQQVRGLFGGAARHLVTQAARVTRIDAAMGPTGALLALAATARHAMADALLPELIVGHGVLGRLLARLTVACGGAPTVWEANPVRALGAEGYAVTCADNDLRRDYRAIYDASGDATLIDTLIARLAKGGELVLAGFYAAPVTFAFPPAFMREARVRIAAEWTPADMEATRALIDEGLLSMDGLITHTRPAKDAAAAYEAAFGDPACLKMILDWSATA